MITVTLRPNAAWAHGHSGYAPKGQDIVCAAVSILLASAAETLRAKERLVLHHRGEGYCALVSMEDCEALEMLRQGLRLLAENYGEYVRVKEERA